MDKSKGCGCECMTDLLVPPLNILEKFLPQETRNFEAFIEFFVAVVCELLSSLAPRQSFSKALSLPFPNGIKSRC